jgi:hypothetical protein
MTSSFVIGLEDFCAAHKGDNIMVSITAQATP